jgi:hypothetical protein
MDMENLQILYGDGNGNVDERSSMDPSADKNTAH